MTVFNQPAHKRPENLTIDSPEPVEPGCLPHHETTWKFHLHKVPENRRKALKTATNSAGEVSWPRLVVLFWWLAEHRDLTSAHRVPHGNCAQAPAPHGAHLFRSSPFPLLWSTLTQVEAPRPPAAAHAATSPLTSLCADAILGGEGLLDRCLLGFYVSGPQIRGMLESP